MNERKKGAVATRVLGSFSEVTADIKERKKKRKKEERKNVTKNGQFIRGYGRY